MKAYKLIAGAAAVLLTIASLRAVLYDVNAWHATSSVSTPALHITDLAPVVVHPSATEMHEAAIADDNAGFGLTTLAAPSDDTADASLQSFGVLGSQLVMPYYSFGKKYGRITKE